MIDVIVGEEKVYMAKWVIFQVFQKLEQLLYISLILKHFQSKNFPLSFYSISGYTLKTSYTSHSYYHS